MMPVQRVLMMEACYTGTVLTRASASKGGRLLLLVWEDVAESTELPEAPQRH
jgi:hypothetical protein